MRKGIARLGFVDPEPQSLVTAVKLGKGWTGKDCSNDMVSNKKKSLPPGGAAQAGALWV